MGISMGQLLFYGGIIGMAAVVVLSVILISVLATGRKRLRKKFDAETRSIKK